MCTFRIKSLTFQGRGNNSVRKTDWNIYASAIRNTLWYKGIGHVKLVLKMICEQDS